MIHGGKKIQYPEQNIKNSILSWFDKVNQTSQALVVFSFST